MNVGGMYSVTNDGLSCARVDSHVAPSNCLQNRSRVERRLLERSIAVDGSDTQEFDARIVGTEEEGIRILDRWL